MTGAREFARTAPPGPLLADAARIAEIDRRYLTIDTGRGPMAVPDVAAWLAEIAGRSQDRWTDADADLVAALATLGAARIRLEQVGMTADPQAVGSELIATYQRYSTALAEIDGVAAAPATGPWWLLPPEILPLRAQVDKHYHRVLEIDGATYLRREHLSRRDAVDPELLPAVLAERLVKLPGGARRNGEPVEPYLRRLATDEIDRHGEPLRLLELVMKAATEDPHHPSDHATLMCPRGPHADSLTEIGKEDFAIYVVFSTGFSPAGEPDVGDREVIRRAMYAHHAAKKARIARKLYGVTGTYQPNDLSDDLGSLGIYHNETAHHRGHQIAGVSTALRCLMTITVTGSHGPHVVHGLTDWRLSRISSRSAAQYRLRSYPMFYSYGACVRAVLETTLSAGVVLPKMMGDWR